MRIGLQLEGQLVVDERLRTLPHAGPAVVEEPAGLGTRETPDTHTVPAPPSSPQRGPRRPGARAGGGRYVQSSRCPGGRSSPPHTRRGSTGWGRARSSGRCTEAHRWSWSLRGGGGAGRELGRRRSDSPALGGRGSPACPPGSSPPTLVTQAGEGRDTNGNECQGFGGESTHMSGSLWVRDPSIALCRPHDMAHLVGKESNVRGQQERERETCLITRE